MTGFTAAAERVGTTVVTAETTIAAIDLIEGLADGPIPISPGARARLGDLPPRWVEPPAEAVALADQPIAVTRAALAVAETGSVGLVEQDRPTALLHMWAHHLVVVLDAGDIVDTLPAAGPHIAEATRSGTVTLLSGPSRTADIERRLTIGVQGPHTVTVVLIDAAVEGAGG